jgi:Phosphotransferase enzyme family
VTGNPLHPLELLHPTGQIGRCIVLGSNCPPRLFPPARWRSDGGPADLVLLAPSWNECQSKGWLNETASLLSKELSRDGLAYAVVPPPWRRQTEKSLRLHGLVVELSVLHLPNLATSHYLVPLHDTLVRYVVERLLGTSPMRRQLALFGLRFASTTQFIEKFSSSMGLVARREKAPPLFNWLGQLEIARAETPRHIVIKSPRPESCHAVLHCFYGTEAYPAAIAKVSRRCAGSVSLKEEFKTLRSFADTVRQSGADVPDAVGYIQIEENDVSLQTVLKGVPATRFLDYKPRRLFGVLESVTKWLEAWNRATTVSRVFDEEIIDRVILDPAKRLARLLDKGEVYVDWLIQLCSRLNGYPVPLVAAHNDLTMSNIIILDDNRLGVIDWETAGEGQLPMTDFYYMVADAAASTQHYADREGSFETCFVRGKYVEDVARLRRRSEKSVGISKDLSLLCFHVCWLRHADNEQVRHEEPRGKPFLGILRKVVANRETFFREQ